MSKVKLLKGNQIFITDPKVLEFIEYCKEKYSAKIEKITMYRNKEFPDQDVVTGEFIPMENDWQITVQEGEPGLVWTSWFIPMSENVNAIDGSEFSPRKSIVGRYGTVGEYINPNSI